MCPREMWRLCVYVCISLAAMCPVVTAPSTATARPPEAETIPSSPAHSWWTASYCRCLSAWSLDLFSKKLIYLYLVQHRCVVLLQKELLKDQSTVPLKWALDQKHCLFCMVAYCGFYLLLLWGLILTHVVSLWTPSADVFGCERLSGCLLERGDLQVTWNIYLLIMPLFWSLLYQPSQYWLVVCICKVWTVRAWQVCVRVWIAWVKHRKTYIHRPTFVQNINFYFLD